MQKFLREGYKTEQIAPSGGVVAGLGYVIGGNLFVIAEGNAAATATFVGIRKGVFRLPKNTSDAVAAGARVFWDNTAKEIRAASATGRFMIGVAEVAQLAATTYADVILDGVSVLVI